MNRLIFPTLFIITLSFIACSKDSCKECVDCKTKASITLCEDDFEKTSDYNDQVDNYVSDGCVCNTK